MTLLASTVYTPATANDHSAMKLDTKCWLAIVAAAALLAACRAGEENGGHLPAPGNTPRPVSSTATPTVEAPTPTHPGPHPPENREASIWEGRERGAYPEVWSSNSPAGQTYEFKVNCYGDYATLEECALWDIDAVDVLAPDGRTFALDKDFNVNTYSGEVTRRWVLYGPEGGELPPPGRYAFRYVRDSTPVHEQTVDYEPEVVGYPTGVEWWWEGDDLHVRWTPGAGMAKGMWYKVLVFPDGGNVLSLTFDWGASSAVLPDLPLTHGQYATLNVAAYFSGGYAPSEYLELDHGGSVR